MPLPTLSNVGHRRYFPAWIESDDGVPALTMAGTSVLPRVRAALPLRQVFAAAVSITFHRKKSNARRLR